MEIEITYSLMELDAAALFVATHNPFFINQFDYIRTEILNHMIRIAKNPEQHIGATMGYILLAEREDEGIDSDINSVHFEIAVSPAVGRDYDEDTIIREKLNV